MIKAAIFVIILLLKIIGVLLLLGLLLLGCLLFVPVRYSVEGQNSKITKPPELTGTEGKNNRFCFKIQINASWLLHLIRYTFEYGTDGTSGTIRIFGLDIRQLSAKWKSRRKQKSQNGKKKHKSQKKQAYKGDSEDIPIPDIEIGGHKEMDSQENRSGKLKQAEHEQQGPEKINQEKSDIEKPGFEKLDYEESDLEKSDLTKSGLEKPGLTESDLEKSDLAESGQKKAVHKKKRVRKKKSFQRKKSFQKKKSVQKKESVQKKKAPRKRKDIQKKSQPSSIRDKLQSFHKEFTDPTNRKAITHVWKELLFLLRCYKPKKVKADLAFSLADPALTGELLGFISMFPSIYKYPCHIVPDFNSEDIYVEGEIFAKGKVTVIIFLISLLRLWRDKEFKYVFNRVRGRG